MELRDMKIVQQGKTTYLDVHIESDDFDEVLDLAQYIKDVTSAVDKKSNYELNGEVYDAYCVKCKEKRMMWNPTIRVSDSGRRMAMGVCGECGTKMNRILGKV